MLACMWGSDLATSQPLGYVKSHIKIGYSTTDIEEIIKHAEKNPPT